MAKDWLDQRFGRKQRDKKLDDLARKARSKDDVEAEEELIEKTKKVEPIEATETPGRNDPCPCGSGRKYKKCCGAK